MSVIIKYQVIVRFAIQKTNVVFLQMTIVTIHIQIHAPIV